MRDAPRALSAAIALACTLAGCTLIAGTDVSPTVLPPPPQTTVASLRQGGVGKVDILFDIDNSASMGDKQDYLKAAIPDLIKRLVQPNCVNDAGAPNGNQTQADGSCATGKPEFRPVYDMHIGVVTSALGPRLGDACNPTEKTAGGLLKHNDDQGRLINRANADEHAMSDMQPSNFLSWFPSVPANGGKMPSPGAVPLTDLIASEKDFADLVSGVHQLGCGIESQLESWYRFLIQPDPYNLLDNPGGRAAWLDVDATIIAQRHDFLRPDSLVAIIVLSDENDSEIDVRSFAQQGWNWMSSGFEPPKGTSQCDANPNDPNCMSCLLAPNKGAGDPHCATPYSSQNDWGYNLNLRHVHMKQKYGVDVQFPIERYVNGLTSSGVPNRDGEYPAGKTTYVGTNSCTNPLFASQLPDGTDLDTSVGGALCKLPLGFRTADLVFYAHIGGVPHELLHFDPTSAQKSVLTGADWEKILGNDPQHYDYTNIDPHMIESFAPRTGLPPPSSADDADPIHGREWVTNSQSNFVDRQYACTFALATPRDCSVPVNADICDCPAMDGLLTHDQTPPVCGTPVFMQTRAKAYPTIREILLARLMGTQGVLSSICPVKVNDNATGDDPFYGYRPAVATIVGRLKNALANQCMPQALTPSDLGNVPCVILEVMPDAASTCDRALGLSDPTPDAIQKLKDFLKNGQPGDPSLNTVCEAEQLVGADLVNGSCAQSTAPGWCYVTGSAAGGCPRALVFSPSGTPANGANVFLECVGQAAADAGGGD
jgi:hypothetical protein